MRESAGARPMEVWVAWGYVLTTLVYLAGCGFHALALAGTAGERPARWLARAGWALHSLVLAADLVHGRMPFLSTTRSVFFVAWAWVLICLFLEHLLDMRALGAFVLPPVILLLVLGAAQEAGGGGGAGGSRLQVGAVDATADPWMALHALVALLSYVAFGLASALALMYLLLERQLRDKVFTHLYRRLPALDVLDRLSCMLIGGGLVLLTLALLSGTLPAGSLWGDGWTTDGKVVGSLVVWTLYALHVAMRGVVGWRGRRLAYLSLLGFIAILVNYLVVGTYWPTRHFFF